MAALTRRCSVASLMKLHRKSKALDAYMDDRMELSTTRLAWNEITDNVERGAYPAVALAPPIPRHDEFTIAE